MTREVVVLGVGLHPFGRWPDKSTGELVRQAAEAAKSAGCEWLHVDYEDDLTPFYEACGFRPTAAGLIRLNGGEHK